MRKLLVALFLLFPVIASAAITISPARVAYNTEGQILSISGSFRPGNVATLVDFTYTDGGVAEVVANSVTSELITCEIPLSVTGQPGPWAVSVVFVDDNGVRTDDGATPFIFANLPPILNGPEVLTAEATSASGAAVDFSGDVNGISFVDPPPAPTISCTPASGSTFALGTTTASCTATDSFRPPSPPPPPSTTRVRSPARPHRGRRSRTASRPCSAPPPICTTTPPSPRSRSRWGRRDRKSVV